MYFYNLWIINLFHYFFTLILGSDRCFEQPLKIAILDPAKPSLRRDSFDLPLDRAPGISGAQIDGKWPSKGWFTEEKLPWRSVKIPAMERCADNSFGEIF